MGKAVCFGETDVGKRPSRAILFGHGRVPAANCRFMNPGIDVPSSPGPESGRFPIDPPKPVWQRLWKPAVVLAVLALGCIGSWHGYRALTLRLSLARAHREFVAKNYPIAEFWTGRAFSVDFENLEAFRLSGELAAAEVRITPSRGGRERHRFRTVSGPMLSHGRSAPCGLIFPIWQ